MYKISDFDYLKEKIDFSYDNDISFYAVAASEDTFEEPMLFYLLDIKYLSVLEKHKNNIAGIICSSEINELIKNNYSTIVTSSPKTLFFLIHNNLKNNNKFPSIIEDGCIISEKASIAPYNVIIKSGTVIDDFVSVKENVEIGNNCYISNGSVVGSEGFNVFQHNGINILVKHYGKVVLGNNVVVLCNSCIAKSIYGHITTLIEDGVMIDNLVQVAHDAKIRKNAELSSGTVLCGFSEVGVGTFMGANSSIKQLTKVGNNNKIGMGAFINFNTGDNYTIAGFQPLPLDEARLLKNYNKKIIEELKQDFK